MTGRCATCRHEVGHLHKLAWLVARFARASKDHPRLRVVRDRYEAAHEKAEARRADHLRREHGAPCQQCRDYVIHVWTAGPEISNNELRAAIAKAADHLMQHVEERAA
jgi:hypothetical protein